MSRIGLRGALAFGAAVSALAAAPSQAQTLQTIRNGNTLVTIGATTPGTVASTVAIVGLRANERLGAIDYRPATPRVLYALSNLGQLYVVNTRTGSATAVGGVVGPPIGGVGLDFNPTVDRIRVVTQIGQDLRVNPDTGAVAAVDGRIAYAPGDPNFRAVPTTAAAAYTNSFAGATTTTLYVLDTRSALGTTILATQGNATVSPNTGQLFTVGSTGVTSNGSVGFDISREGSAFATFTNPVTGITSLYTVNLGTGTATLVGALAGNMTYEGLAVQLASFASMGATANASAVGNVFDTFTGAPGGDLLALFNGIDGQFATEGAQAAALLALSPAAFSNLPEVSLNLTEEAEAGVLGYTRDLRGNGTMANGSTATLDAAGRVGVWLIGGARFGSYDTAVDRPRTSTDDFHVLGGLDFRPTPKTALGVFGGYGETDARFTDGNSVRGNLGSALVGGYATTSVGPLYVDAWGSYTDLDWSIERNLAIGAFAGSANARTDGRVYAAGAATGLSFAFAGLEVEPFAAVRYADVRVDGFSENGGSVIALSVGDFDRESIRSNLGARVGAKLAVAGVTVRPQLRGSWYHEFKNQADTIDANFVTSGIQTPFGFTTTPLSEDYFSAGAGFTIAGEGAASIVADYDVQFDDDRELHMATFGVRLAF